MLRNSLPYVIVLLVINVCFLFLNAPGAVYVQLGPLIGMLSRNGPGGVWFYTMIVAAGMLCCSWFLRKYFVVSFVAFALAVIVWYGSAIVSIFLLE
jgi:hypothetical protein